jgi:DNA mismatch repair protein MutS
VVKHARSIIKCANQLAELDVAVSMAEAAIAGGYVRPELVEGSAVWRVEQGRHPVIDNILAGKGASFVSNSCHLNHHVALITGPNMGGKSTFLRQNALMAIMAQAGSFVPAKSATIGIVDAVYTRIGAADDLSRDRSTFMVEMEETARICRHASPHSLVLMDEVGRGTSGDEGLALAFGIVKHLIDIGCRTLFATHLNGLAKCIPDGTVEKWRTTVTQDENGSIVVVPKVIQGVSEHSYAISIARLAGIPENVLAEASSHLERIRLA